MSRMLRCANGHQWSDTLGLNDGGTVDLTSACPTCGAQGLAEDGTQVVSVSAGPSAAVSNPPSNPSHTDLMTLATDNLAPVPSDQTSPLSSSGEMDDGAATLPDSAASHASHDPATLPLSSSEEHDLDRTEGGEDDGEQSASTRLLDKPANDGGKTLDQTQATAPPRPTDIGNNPGVATGKRGPVGPTRATGKFKKDAKLPDRVAGYEILGLLGRGGMGVVYKARQAGLNRLCALKMIIGGGHASQDAVMRFKIEAKAIAHLQHPNIVQVYEIGEENGCPYFSLEFVDGTTLQNKIASTPQPPAETARMMMQICQGVHAAHMRGVLHRDLKPANVLLTKDNVPKITDFGLAKRLEDEDHGQTRTGAIMGTPSYMAPEQAMGKAKELGPPADIYSLGAVMYDMLTGRPPFRGETVMDTLNQVQTLEPMAPEKLVPKVPRDLQTICLKALNKDIKKRYATAADMAEDLRRYLANEPIMARPTPAWERGVKWAKRRPALATLISVSTVAFVAVLTFGGLWLDSARAAAEDKASNQTKLTKAADDKRVAAEQLADVTAKAEQEEKALRAKDEASFKIARRAVDEMLTKVGTVNLEYEPRMENLRNELLEKALKFNEEFLAQRGNDSTVLFYAAKSYEDVGKIKRMLGNYDESEERYQTAIERYKQVSQVAGAPLEHRKAIASCTKDLALVQQFNSKPAQSEKGFLQALAEYDTLRSLAPEDPEIPKEMANLEGYLGNLCYTQGRLLEAEDHYDTALSLWNTLLAKGIDDASARQALGSLQINRGVLLFTLGKKLESEKSLVAARDRFAALSGKSPDVPDYATDWGLACINLGIVQRKSGRALLSTGSFEDAIEILAKLRTNFPDTPIYTQKLAHAHAELGILNGEQMDFGGARDQLTLALDMLDKLHGRQPKLKAVTVQLAQTHITLGIAYVALSDVDHAVTHYRKGIELLDGLKPTTATMPEAQIQLARGHENLATALTDFFNQVVEADKSWVRLLALREELAAAFPKSPGHRADLAEAHKLFAASFLKNNKPAEAVKHMTAAVAQMKEAVALLPKNSAFRERLWEQDRGLAKACLANQDYAGAASAAEDATNVMGKDEPGGAQRHLKEAEIFGQCMVQAESDKSLSADRRKTLIAEYGDKALAALTIAVAAGYQDVNHLKTAPEFRLLREREGFQALIRDLEAKVKAK